MKRLAGSAAVRVVAVSLLAGIADARAGGFLIYEHSAVATGMADARTALWDDPSSLFFNPAAITELDGFNLSLGDTLITGTTAYAPFADNEGLEGTIGARTQPRLFYPMHVHFTAQATPWLTAGVSVTNPFGLGSSWPSYWDGRFTAWQTDLETFFVQPAVALDVADLAGLPGSFRLSFAAGGSYVYATALIRQKVDFSKYFPGEEGTLELDATAHGGGYNFALFAAWLPWVSVGASVRSNVRIDLDGNAGFKDLSPSVRSQLDVLAPLPESTGGSTSIELPWNMNFGVAFHGLPKFTFAVDLYVALWESYDELAVRFSCAEGDTPTCWPMLNDPENSVFAKNWKTDYEIAAGIEYRPVRGIALRAGYGYVTDPTDPATYDAMLPDGDRHLISVGFGLQAPSWFKLDVGYMLAIWDGTKNNEVGHPTFLGNNGLANGTYETVTHLLGVTVGLAFGGDDDGAFETLDPVLATVAATAAP